MTLFLCGVCGHAEKDRLVSGVEACMWSEFVDATNFISRFWPVSLCVCVCEGLGIGRSALDSLSVPGPLSASTQHMCVNGSVLRLLLSVRGLQSLSTIQTLLFLGLQSSGAPLLWLQTKKVERDRERKIARQRQRQTETKRQRQRERCTCTHMHTHAHTCTHMHTHAHT